MVHLDDLEKVFLAWLFLDMQDFILEVFSAERTLDLLVEPLDDAVLVEHVL